MKSRLLLIASVLVNTVPRLFNVSTYRVIQGELNEQEMALYFKGDAISFMLMMLAFLYKDSSHETDIYVWWCLGLTVSNVLDETVFNPYYLQAGEVGLVTVITLTAVLAMQFHKKRRWAIALMEVIDYVADYIPSRINYFITHHD